MEGKIISLRTVAPEKSCYLRRGGRKGKKSAVAQVWKKEKQPHRP
jgi:hypothetical protein